jgi:hypothetical protein
MRIIYYLRSSSLSWLGLLPKLAASKSEIPHSILLGRYLSKSLTGIQKTGARHPPEFVWVFQHNAQVRPCSRTSVISADQNDQVFEGRDMSQFHFDSSIALRSSPSQLPSTSISRFKSSDSFQYRRCLSIMPASGGMDGEKWQIKATL